MNKCNKNIFNNNDPLKNTNFMTKHFLSLHIELFAEITVIQLD